MVGAIGSKHPEIAVQDTTIIYARHASGLVGQKGLDDAPLQRASQPRL
jgi:hypothetical protein